ncbi:MAG: hypothetical protein ACTSSJ_07525 [Candidatus Odinarchaeia archaeon]
MSKIEVLTIKNNSDNHPTESELLKTIEKAVKYFPKGIWDAIEYLGSINLDCDLKLVIKGKILSGYLFQKTISKIRKIKENLKINELTMAVTFNPIIYLYYKIINGKLEKIVNLVHDYVNKHVGVISLFEIDSKLHPKVAAHGLGHSKGLEHHFKPVDLMYVNILKEMPKHADVFCPECTSKLQKLVSP